MIRQLLLLLALLCGCGTARAQHTEPSDSLRILCIGNSFADDGMIYLPDLLDEAGVKGVVLARLYFPGCSLEQHCRFYDEQAANYTYYKSTDNRWVTLGEHVTLARALDEEPWDIVVLQQASHFSGLYESYLPWLEQLIGIVKSHVEHPRLKFAWHMTWAYAEDSDHDGFANYGDDQQQMYEAIVAVAQRIMSEQQFDYLIPSGTAIQNLRVLATATLRDATRDGYHLDLGVGRYTAACTWFEALIRPYAGCGVRGDSFRVEAGPEATAVTDGSAERCRTAAEAACAEPLKTMPMMRHGE